MCYVTVTINHFHTMMLFDVHYVAAVCCFSALVGYMSYLILMVSIAVMKLLGCGSFLSHSLPRQKAESGFAEISACYRFFSHKCLLTYI